MIPSNVVTCWGTSTLHCQHDRQKCFMLLQLVWKPKVQMGSKEISQIHEGYLHQWQLNTMAQMQTLAEEIHIFLNAGTWENTPRERLSFSLSFCFCLSIHYLPSLSAKWHSDLGMAFPFSMLTEINRITCWHSLFPWLNLGLKSALSSKKEKLNNKKPNIQIPLAYLSEDNWYHPEHQGEKQGITLQKPEV